MTNSGKRMENSPLTLGPLQWNKRDWISLLLISLFLSVHAVMAGFPVIDWDSQRYLNAALFFKSNPFALTTVCFLLKPLVLLIGPWGFVWFQIFIVAYCLASVLKHFDKNCIVGLIAIAISLCGYFAICVMMDIYTVTGLLALFLLLNGSKDVILYLIFGLCFIAHPENLLMFPLCALIYWAIFNKNNFKNLILLIFVLLGISIVSVMGMNYWQDKEIRFFPKAKYIMLMTHIATDSPEIAREYMEKYSDSELSKEREFYESTLVTTRPYHILLWDGKKAFAFNDKIQQESGKFIFYAFKYHPFVLLSHFFKNTFFSLVHTGEYVTTMHPDKGPINFLKVWTGDQLSQAKKSLQYKGQLLTIIRQFKYIYIIDLCASVLALLLYIFYFLRNQTKVNSKYYAFALFAIIIILVNACIMPNFIGLYLRYQLRIMLIPCLAMILIVADFLILK